MNVPAPDSNVWIDGKRTRGGAAAGFLSDPAVQAGLGLFETLARRGETILDLEPHLDRLEAGARALNVPVPSRELLRGGLSELVAADPQPSGWLKILVTRGGRWVLFGGPLDPDHEGRDASAVLLPWRRNPWDPLVGFKTLNYGASVVGLERARDRGADEGLWLNTRGHLAEGCTSNLFVIEGGKLFTASVRDGILPGVVRALVLRAARASGMTLHEGKLRLRRLEQAKEAFLTSSLRGVRPLVAYEGQPVGKGTAGETTRRLAASVAKMRAEAASVP